MPSREEIAGWLREAALIVDYTVAIDTPGPIKKSVFHQRASQVEAMRCENCNKVSDCVAYLVMGQVAKDFGCLLWKSKEDSNNE